MRPAGHPAPLPRAAGLRARVTIVAVAVLACGVGLLSVAANLLLGAVLGHDADAVLRTRSDAQLATLGVRGGRLTVFEGPADDALDRQVWVFDGGRAIERAAAPPPVQRAVDALATVRAPVLRDGPGATRLLARPACGGARRCAGTVVVALSLAPYEHTRRVVLAGTAALDLFVLVGGAVVVRAAVGRPLRAVAEMTRRAAAWSAHDLDGRFDLGPPRDELTGLAATLDGLLGRIAASRRHERRLAAELAHELRTPLSGIRAEAELALHQGAATGGARDALRAVLRGTDRVEGVIRTLLTAARGETDGGTADAATAAGAAVEGARAAARARGVILAVLPPPAPVLVGAGADLVAQALRPLLDNALRHARTRVTVGIQIAPAAPGLVAFTIADDGDGLPPGDPEALFEPGRRGPGSDGAGLGLALARRLARAGGGDVTAVPSPAGGRFVVALPVAAVDVPPAGPPAPASAPTTPAPEPAPERVA